MEKKIFGVPKNVFFLGLVSFFNDFSAEMVQSVMPVFLTVTLGAPAFFVGLIEGVADALSSVVKLVSGWMSDRLGRRKRPAVAGYSLSVLTRLFLALVSTFWQVFALRVVDRLGKGLRDSPRDALIAESVPKETLGLAFGFHRAADTLGATLGPLLGFCLIFYLALTYQQLFLVAFFLGLFAIASFVFVEDIPAPAKTPSKRAVLQWSIFKEHKAFIWVVAALFLLGLGALPIGLVLLKAKEIGSLGEVPLMYFVYSATFVIVAIPIGKLADRIGEKLVIAGGFLIAAISYAGLAFTSHLIVLIMLFIALGVYSACTDGMQRVLAAKFLGRELAATGQGFLNMAIGFSSLGAGIAGGLLWTLVNSQSAFLYAAAVSLIGLIFFAAIANMRART
jgi:MFS family permease